MVRDVGCKYCDNKEFFINKVIWIDFENVDKFDKTSNKSVLKQGQVELSAPCTCGTRADVRVW